MPQPTSAFNRLFPVVLIVTLAGALLPAGMLRPVNDVAAVLKLPITPLSDGLNSLMSWLRPPPVMPMDDLDGDDIRQIAENAELYKQMYLALQQRTRQLEERIRQLEQIPTENLRTIRRRLQARITTRSLSGSHGTVDLRRGSREGVTSGTVAVYEGVHLLGRVTDDVTAIGSKLLPLTNESMPPIRASVQPGDTAAELRTRPLVIHIEPAGDGTFIADVDAMEIIEVGDVVRLDDGAWPPAAQQMVIGVVDRIDKNDEAPLRERVIVRPHFQVYEVTHVVLLIESDSTDDEGPSTGDGS